MRNLIAAIDLGTSKVVCLVGEKTEAGIKVIAINEAPAKGISRGEVINIQSALDAMTPTISAIENTIGEKITDVFVGIAGQYIRCQQGTDHTTRTNPEELITGAEIKQITKKMLDAPCVEGEEVIHAIPQSYNIDDFMGITEPVGMNGCEIFSNFKLISGKKSSSHQKANVMKRAGLNLKGMFFEPLASAKAVLDDEEREVGVALLDIGGGTTDLVIIQDNVVRHAAVIPFGGNSITEDLKQGCGVSAKVAEQLKTLHGSCMSSIAPDKNVRINGIGGREDKQISLRNIAEIIESRVEEILEAAIYEIEKSGYMNQINSGLVITGGTSQLTNMQQFARLVTGLDIRLAVPNRQYAEIEIPINKPSLSTAVGLVVMGFEKMEEEGVKFTSTSTNWKKPTDAEKPSKEVSEPQTDKDPKPGNKGFRLRDIFGQFKNDNMFNENDA